MKQLNKYFLLLISLGFLVSCKKDDDVTIPPPRDRQEVFDENLAEIETYLQSSYMTFDADMNVTIDSIPDGGSQVSIWDQTAYPLQYITVKNDLRTSLLTDGRIVDPVDYKLYYIVLNEGGGQVPTSVDSTFTAYKGWNLSNTTVDQNNTGIWFSFPENQISSISGFRQILSVIKTATGSTANSNGTVSYTNFGNVIVFIPSGLAYFNTIRPNVARYKPIAFQIKLLSRKQRDHDNDRVLSNYEDLNGNNDFFDDDTDGDKIPNFLDKDDDGDSILTKNELTYDVNGNVIFPFDDCDGDGIPNYLDTDPCP
jgi:FKBP-type peptidyl-prolyl cis-trans isomerase FkpA